MFMRKIMIVEDESPLREVYGLILSSQPYTIQLATDGKHALTLCQKDDYDLILLDLMMPELTGLEFLQKFHGRKPEKTKIIMLSNVSTSKDLEKCLTLGAHRSAVKASLSPKQLLAMVRYELET
jgi:DNA-binding response OmpR family regulator